MIEFRNPAFNAAGTIDVEIAHPQFGWIPFTASPDDSTEYGPSIYAEAIQGDVAEYVPPEPVVPDRVSRRQFKMQLVISGLSEQVATWVASQNELVQIAFNESGEFVRTEPMMAAGFAALGFTPEQVDAFFTAAAEI